MCSSTHLLFKLDSSYTKTWYIGAKIIYGPFISVLNIITYSKLFMFTSISRLLDGGGITGLKLDLNVSKKFLASVDCLTSSLKISNQTISTNPYQKVKINNIWLLCAQI